MNFRFISSLIQTLHGKVFIMLTKETVYQTSMKIIINIKALGLVVAEKNFVVKFSINIPI